MARKRPRLARVLGGRDFFSIAYGEVASSIYFALGIVAAKALGLTPLVLLIVGGIFLLVALSYAEAITSTSEAGGSVSYVRRAFNDVTCFVMGLTTLFVPHYLAAAFHISKLRSSPYDSLVAVGLVLALTLMRFAFRPRLYRFGIILAALDLVTQFALIALGLAMLFSWHSLSSGVHLGSSPSWGSLAFAL
ncbi:MAG: APC family permease, partial [Gaiellaceae bacterium]